MNRIRLPLLVLGILSSSQWPMGVHVVTADGQATRAHVLVLDVAADCRTYAPTTARGETNMVTGKIFPAERFRAERPATIRSSPSTESHPSAIGITAVRTSYRCQPTSRMPMVQPLRY